MRKSLLIGCLLCPLAAVFAQTVTLFPVPAQADQLTAGPDGNVWYTDQNNMIAKITPTGAVTRFPLGTQAFGIVTGPDNNLWFAEYAANMIARAQLPASSLCIP